MDKDMKRFLCFVFFIILIVSCAPKRPIIYHDPKFNTSDIFEEKMAYFIIDTIDITPVVQDFIVHFDGDPEYGEKYTLTKLKEYLSGNRGEKNTIYINPRKRATEEPNEKALFNMVDVEKIMDIEQAKSAINISHDKYGLASVIITQKEILKSMHSDENVRYLMVITDLTVMRNTDTSNYPIASFQDFPVPGMATGIASGGSTYTSMGAQVFLIDLNSMSLCWNGFIQGERSITKEYGDGIALGFTKDLQRAFR